MLGVLYKKMHIGVIRPRIRVRNEISRFLEILEFEYFPFVFFGSEPGFDHCSEHISDPKETNGKFMNSTPPPFGTSAENPGTLDLSLYAYLLPTFDYSCI